jgi:tRNA pseudouridine38-40 synthase
MQEASNILLDYKDFECFSRSNTDVNTYLCDIKEASWKEVDGEYHFTITADRFLRNMVRAVVGTLLEIGQGKRSVSWMHEVIKRKNRSLAGSSAPAHGLYLTDIGYPKNIFID